MTKNSCRNIEKQVLFYVNRARKKRCLSGLKHDKGLTHLAKRHSAKMAKRRRIWHGGNVRIAEEYVKVKERDYSSLGERVIGWIFTVFGYLLQSSGLVEFGKDLRGAAIGVRAENVEMMSKGRVKIGRHVRDIRTDKDIARALHDNWMGSSGHRKNILTQEFKKIGIGIKRNGNGFYATELFYG